MYLRRELLALVLPVTLLLPTGCGGARSQVANLDQVILLDVQGLFGGTDLWIAADGKSVCRFVEAGGKSQPGLRETRYSFVVSEAQRSALLDLVNQHGFFTVTTRKRAAVPDEAHPCIFMKSGTFAHAVCKLANDKHKDFDPIYQLLLQVAESGKKGSLLRQGAYEPDWQPGGFEKSGTIYDKVRAST